MDDGTRPDKLTQNELEIAANALMRLNDKLSQRIDWVLSREESSTDAHHDVALLTLHSAKGLEFAQVWIIGAEETVLQSEKALLAEERRLMYVGMTRAREQLVISAPAKTRPALRTRRAARHVAGCCWSLRRGR